MNARIYLVVLIAATPVGCGPRLNEIPFDDREGATSQMAEPVQLKSLNAEVPAKTETGRPKSTACDPDMPLPSEVQKGADAETLHTHGQQFILSRNASAALATLMAADKLKPNDPHILGDLAIALLQCGRWDESAKRAEKSAALAPDDVDITANLAQIYQIIGRMDEAIAKYRSAIDIDASDHAAYNNLAVLLVAKKHFKDAELAAREATRLAPNNGGYWVNLGYVLFRQKRLVDAEMVLNRVVALDPENANAFNQLGLVLAAQKRNVKAKESFLKALSLNPHHRAARENLEAMRQMNSQIIAP